jgi:hypothetical protein
LKTSFPEKPIKSTMLRGGTAFAYQAGIRRLEFVL